MTESNKTEQDNDENRVLSFGEHLYIERTKQNLSITEISKVIHLSEKIIDAIERSDIEHLPQPAFVQGYLRVYAKHLGISETLVLQEYARAVPHKLETELQPRCTLPREASSNSPFVKMVTILLFAMMAVAAFYASFIYYKNAIVATEIEMDGQVLLSLPDSSLESETIQQSDAEYDVPPVDAEPVVVEPVDVEPVDVEPNIVQQPVIVKEKVKVKASEVSAGVVVKHVSDKTLEDKLSNQKPVNQLTVKGNDVLELLATQISWVEVDDANAENLYYDLLQQDQRLTLKGMAPFKVFLGNAPNVKVKINDTSVNIDKYIRSNNIANFNISIDQQKIVFH